MKNEKILNIVIVVCVVILVAFFSLNRIIQNDNEKEYSQLLEEQNKQRELEKEKHAIVLNGGEGNVFEKLSEADVLLTPDDCLNKVSDYSFDKRTVTVKTNTKSGIDDNLLLYFEALAKNECNKLSVRVSSGKKEMDLSFYVQTQLHGYYVPIKNFPQINSIKFSIEEGNGGVTVKNVELINAYDEDIPNEYHGSVNISESCENIVIENRDGIPVDNAQDIICDDKFAYIGNMNNVFIASLEDKENPVIISSVTDLGTVRRLELSPDGKTLIVASREYGVFLIDITDAYKPFVVSHIDALELASGVDAVGDYLFIASRYYGIEIYDISNPKEPVFCSSVKSNNESECIDCKVYGDYMYVGVWATRRIEVFDIKDISNPKYIDYIPTDGNTYGLDVYEDKLVISTGFHSEINSYDSVYDYGYGTGNGLSIYSLEKPDAPKLLSTVKSDYRYYYIGMDYWNVRVSDGYAYLSDLYNGLYIYDIKDGKNPLRVAKVTIPILAGNENYVDMSGENNVYGFDPKEMVLSPVTGAGFSNGYVYVANTLSDVYPVKLDIAKTESGENYDFNNSGAYCYSDFSYDGSLVSVENYRIEGQTYAIDQEGDYLYAGTSYGIMIFDTDMNKVGFYETKDAVRDLQILNGKLYTAEGLNGISIYQIDGKMLTLLGNFVPKEENRSNVCSQLGVSPDGKYVVTSCRLNLTVMLDVSDPKNIFIELFLKAGAVYYRNIADGYANNAIYISHAAGVSEIVFDNEGGYKYTESSNMSYFYSTAGFAAYDKDRILAVCKKGYQILDVSDGFKNVKEDELVYLGIDYMLKGSPAVNSNILCVGFPSGGQITVLDITNPEKPEVKANFKTGGCPDTAYISDDGVIYIPCRYEGIKRITIN